MPDRGTALSPDYVLTVKSSSDPKKMQLCFIV